MDQKHKYWVQGAAGGAVVALSVGLYMGWIVTWGESGIPFPRSDWVSATP
jgi:hypothetical protein